MNIKKYVVDGEYVMGNIKYPYAVRNWLINKGAKYKLDDWSYATKYCAFYVEEETKKVRCAVKGVDGFTTERLLFEYGTEVDISIPETAQATWDPFTLKPFDKVLVKYADNWYCDIFSHYLNDIPYLIQNRCLIGYKYLPYNKDTEYLLGTNYNDIPKYYNY